VVQSARLGENIALGYVHRDHLAPGTSLQIAGLDAQAAVAALPFSS
jgi:glycine cleavage system aminomethyltransferase T